MCTEKNLGLTYELTLMESIKNLLLFMRGFFLFCIFFIVLNIMKYTLILWYADDVKNNVMFFFNIIFVR